MEELFKWLLTSGDQITAPGLLMAGFGLTVIALYREWIVLGKPYRACMTRVAEFEKQATERAAANEAKVDELEAQIEALRDARESNRRRS